MGLEWDWNVIGKGLEWDWNGIGTGVERDWNGIGMGLDGFQGGLKYSAPTVLITLTFGRYCIHPEGSH